MTVIFEGYRRYTDGFLPRKGGSQEQPAILMRMIDIVADEQQKHSERLSRGDK